MTTEDPKLEEDEKPDPAKQWPWSQIGELVSRLKGYQTAEAVWRSGLTKHQRVELGGDLKKALEKHGDIVSIWREVWSAPLTNLGDDVHTKRIEYCIAVAQCSYYGGFLFDKGEMDELISRIVKDADVIKPV